MAVSKSLKELAREGARVQGQPAGREEDDGSSDVSGPLPVSKPARVVPGRQHRPVAHANRSFDVSKRRVGRVVPGAKNCENPRSATDCFVSTLLGTFLTRVKERVLPLIGDVELDGVLGRVLRELLCPGNSASPWFTASCCSDGSLAVFLPLWLQKTSEVSSLLEEVATAHGGAYPTCNASILGKHCASTHPSQSSSYGSVNSHLAGDVFASVRLSGQQASARTQGWKSVG